MVDFTPALIKKGVKVLKSTSHAFATERVGKFAALIPDNLALTEGRRMVGQTLLSLVRKKYPELDKRSPRLKKHKPTLNPSNWKTPADLARAVGHVTQEEALIQARLMAGVATMLKDSGALVSSSAGEVFKPADWARLFDLFVALPKSSNKKNSEKENVIHL